MKYCYRNQIAIGYAHSHKTLSNNKLLLTAINTLSVLLKTFYCARWITNASPQKIA